MNESPPAGIDVTRPSVARVYDYWLGGKDNFASDREMGGRMAEVNPALPQLVRHNREFICAAAARAAAAGISQFLDLGSGLPAHPAVHEAVRQVIPDARVCYVDIDPVAVAVANANARLNGVGAFCRPIVSRGFENAALREAAPYDLVFANILAKPLRLLAPSLAAIISADGDGIVSGLLLADVPGVLASWRAQGFHLAERIELEGWASLRLRR